MMKRQAIGLGSALAGAVLILLAFLASPAATADDKPATTADAEFFEARIRPVLVEHCQRCHGPEKAKGGLRLDSRAAALKGGDSGPALVPGSPEKSRLIEAVGYGNTELTMPPKGKLPEAVVADLTDWVKRGAPWPGDSRVTPPGPPVVAILQQNRDRWCWRPVANPKLPAVHDGSWPSDPVDRFILARLEEKGLRPAVPADRRTLLRRVTFDLTGLPPTPEEIDAFLADQSPEAWEKVVDRLLASPAYGERWARHWLDLVRYAESRGHEFEPNIPNAYQYRDYVIRAFNADVPYDQFVREHVAGDLLPTPRRHPTTGGNESVLGTGFWFLGEEVHSPVDIRQDQADRFDNRIDVFSKTFLGLTVSCARCHDHKFDPIPTKDYYALFGFLSSSSYRLVRFDSLEQNRAAAASLATVRARSRGEVGKALAHAARPATERLADYLLAARLAVQAGPTFEPAKGPVRADGFSKATRQHLDELAERNRLDPALLAAWTAALLNAARDRQDPLHAWALLSASPDASSERLRPFREELQRQDATAAHALDRHQVVIDYTTSRPADWLQDEASFGSGPARPGDVRLGGKPEQPAVRFVERGAAEYDRAFDVLRLAPGAENDPGALGRIPLRAGRTLCTPSFKLTSGKVWYLVRGAGGVYAAVSAHAVIEGPLHGQLVRTLPAGNDFHWEGQDLTRYQGLDVHLEFTAAAGSDFAVALVVQGEQPPASVDRPSPGLLRLLTDDGRSVEALAAGYRRLFAEALSQVAGDGERAPDTARLANWLVRHPELLGAGAKDFTAVATRSLEAEKRAAVAIKAESRLAPALLDGSGVDEHVFLRGSPRVEGDLAPRRLLEALVGPKPIAGTGSGRLDLARQMTDPGVNPFVARVLVNRTWHHLFGRGLVASVDNFGTLGEAPTHPELLDHLASRFVAEGWSHKRLVRELVLSSTYRMSSKADPEANRADPSDLLLHRARLRRLEGEAIRDAMLSVSGRLDRTLYGPSVPIHLTAFLDGRGRPASGPVDGNGRRSLYLAVRRNFLSPFLLTFDTPSPFSTVGRRTVSNVPAQSLILMNDPFVAQQAEVWARRVLASPGSTDERITRMYTSAFGRPPTNAERTACITFLGQQAALHQIKPDDPKVWTDLAHTLFNVKEFIFLE